MWVVGLPGLVDAAARAAVALWSRSSGGAPRALRRRLADPNHAGEAGPAAGRRAAGLLGAPATAQQGLGDLELIELQLRAAWVDWGAGDVPGLAELVYAWVDLVTKRGESSWSAGGILDEVFCVYRGALDAGGSSGATKVEETRTFAVADERTHRAEVEPAGGGRRAGGRCSPTRRLWPGPRALLELDYLTVA